MLVLLLLLSIIIVILKHPDSAPARTSLPPHIKLRAQATPRGGRGNNHSQSSWRRGGGGGSRCHDARGRDTSLSVVISAPMVGQQGCRPMSPRQGFQRAGIKEEIKRITLIKRLFYIGQGAGHFLNIFSFNVHPTSFPRSGSCGSGSLSNLPRDAELNLNPTLPKSRPCRDSCQVSPRVEGRPLDSQLTISL